MSEFRGVGPREDPTKSEHLRLVSTLKASSKLPVRGGLLRSSDLWWLKLKLAAEDATTLFSLPLRRNGRRLFQFIDAVDSNIQCYRCLIATLLTRRKFDSNYINK